jgi:hypothetical protein
MKNSKKQDKSLTTSNQDELAEKLELQLKKCLFFKNDSYLSNYLSKESVFSQNPETKTTTFHEKSSFLFGEWFNE